ncbi:MAG: c-type cytochrome [Aquificae bacterium]|nr:c-type cytochrome [Aquificota bacterium]
MKFFLVLLLLLVPLYSFGEGDTLYKKHCASCHGKNRLGKLAPPLLPIFLKKMSLEKFTKVVKNGIPASQMPSFSFLSREQIQALYSYVKKPIKISWKKKDIEKSIKILNKKFQLYPYKDIKNVTLVVERGKNSIWILEKENLLGKFKFSNVHGGIKFSKTGNYVFVPSRDGWVAKVNIKRGSFVGKVRPCVYLRNIDISQDYILASCWLPKSLVLLDKKSLKPVKIFKVGGKISAVYSLYKEPKAVFSFRDKTGIYLLDLNDFKFRRIDTKSSIVGFFIDPFDRYLIGSSKEEKKLFVYDLESGSIVFKNDIPSMPHLFSVAVWYNKGNFYFGTRHISSPILTVWKMYDWSLEKQIKLSGNGFFVRTHPDTPYLWTDVSSDTLVLINKRNFQTKQITPIKGKTFLHTEFSGDGKLAYLSIYDKNGYLLILNSQTLKEVSKFSASLPVGKYNYINKDRRFLPQLLGEQIYIQKCWGCHHTQEEAFAPSFKRIAMTRDEKLIMAQILNPGGTYRLLGYKENYMPRFNFSKEELQAVISFIKKFKEDK